MLPLKVLHCVSGGFSGATRVAVEIVRAHLARADMRPVLVLREKKNTQQFAAVYQDLPHEIVRAWTHWGAVRQMATVMKKHQADVVVAHGFPDHLIARAAAVAAGVPCLVQVEHSPYERYTPRHLRWAEQLLPHTQAMIAVSEGVARALLARHPQYAGRIRVILNGVDTARFESHRPLLEREQAILMAARFARDKDHETLIRAFAQCKTKFPDWRLDLAGGGKKSHRRRAEQCATRLGLGDSVRFLGVCHDLPERLPEYPVFVMSSLREGLSLSVLEAQAAGCLVVGSAIDGVQELLGGRRGLLFPAGDAAALSVQLSQVLARPQLFEDMAQRGQTNVLRHHSIRAMADAYANCFLEWTQ